MAEQRTHYVMHTGTEVIHLQLDDHWYHIPPNEPYEIEDGQFYVDKLLEIYQPVYGLINVPFEKTRTGLVINVDAAEVEANRVLGIIEDRLVVEYARAQMEDRVKAGKPVLPPAEGSRVEQIIKKNKIDLRGRFNLNPVGTDSAPYDDPEKAKLRAEAQLLRDQLAEQVRINNERFERLEALLTKKGKD